MKLIYNSKHPYPLQSLSRFAKFVKRGYEPNARCIVDLAEAISKLDMHNPLVYNEQTKGMYGIKPKDYNAVDLIAYEGSKDETD